jgi:hypothetical protein
MGLNLNRELKDFISANEAGNKSQAFKTDEEYKRARINTADYQNSPEYRQMQAESIKSGTGVNTAHQRLLASQANWYDKGGYNQTQPMVPNPDATLGNGYNAPVIPTGDTTRIQPPPSAAPPATPQVTGAIDTGEDTQSAASGGMIQPKRTKVAHFADGGVVSDGDGASDSDTSSNSTGSASSAPVDTSSDDDADDPSQPYYRDPSGRPFSKFAANDGVQAGLQQMAMNFGSHGAIPTGMKGGMKGAGSSPRMPRAGGRAPQNPSGDVSDQQIEYARKMVDPDGKLPEGDRNLAALGAVWQYYVKKGDLQKGANAAAAMLTYYKQQSAKYADIAKQAADGGDATTASAALMKSYNYVPDGRHTKLVPTQDGTGVQFESTGDDGAVTRRGIISPQQIGAAATGFINGDSFEKALLEGAGIRDQKNGTAKGAAGGVKPADREKNLGLIDEAYKAEVGDSGDKNPDIARQLKGTASRIMGDNEHITPEEAMHAAAHLSASKPDADDKRGFGDTKKRQPDGSYLVSMRGGPSIKLSQDTMQQLMAMRASKVEPEGPGVKGDTSYDPPRKIVAPDVPPPQVRRMSPYQPPVTPNSIGRTAASAVQQGAIPDDASTLAN